MNTLKETLPQSESVQHTPGPWAADGYDNTTESVIVNSAWGCVTRVYVASDYKQRDANARLIASAPELLAALQDLLSLALDEAGSSLTLSEVFGTHGGRTEMEGHAARAAIAKALTK